MACAELARDHVRAVTLRLEERDRVGDAGREQLGCRADRERRRCRLDRARQSRSGRSPACPDGQVQGCTAGQASLHGPRSGPADPLRTTVPEASTTSNGAPVAGAEARRKAAFDSSGRSPAGRRERDPRWPADLPSRPGRRRSAGSRRPSRAGGPGDGASAAPLGLGRVRVWYPLATPARRRSPRSRRPPQRPRGCLPSIEAHRPR